MATQIENQIPTFDEVNRSNGGSGLGRSHIPAGATQSSVDEPARRAASLN